jgi:hypothetical protein
LKETRVVIVRVVRLGFTVFWESGWIEEIETFDLARWDFSQREGGAAVHANGFKSSPVAASPWRVGGDGDGAG